VCFLESISHSSTTDSPGDSIQHLEWSPNSCPRALLIVNAAGRASIWSQPTQVSGHFH
jgi:hypothetical protein